MTRKVTEYDHLNDPNYNQGEIKVRIPLDDLAQRVLSLNYGLWRFISSLNRVVQDPTAPAYIANQKEEVETLVKAFENLPDN